MEDEFTKRLDAQIRYYQNSAMECLKVKDVADYHLYTGRVNGLVYSKEMYLLLKEMNKI